MTKKLSYMLFSGKMHDDVKTMVPGLFQWSTAFNQFGKGGILSDDIHKSELENFDVVHVNYTPANASYIAAIREALGTKSDTKIIANVDYAMNMWNGMDPYITKAMLSNADMIFHVEPYGAVRLSSLMEKKVHTIPHPVDTVEIQKMASEDREPVIMCQYHRYFDTWHDYWWGLREIRKQYPHMMVVLMNYTLPKNGRGNVPVVAMFDKLVGYMPYHEYLRALSHAMINIDLAPDYTYGRGVVDAAALGVPTIGNSTIRAMRVLFPGLTLPNTSEDIALTETCNRLLERDDVYDSWAKHGMEKCHYYSLENSYNRMVDVICESC